MVTAIFPVQIGSNTFWSSPQGLSCIEKFLRMMAGVKVIEQGVVITEDPDMFHIAGQLGLEVEDKVFLEYANSPRSFDDIVSIGQRFENISTHSSDAILVIDHRNLMLRVEDISRAYGIREQASGEGVVSLKFCKDHPCQYRAYSTFLGAATFHFDDHGRKAEDSGSSRTHPHSVTWKKGAYGEVAVTVDSDGNACRLSLCGSNPVPEKIMAWVIPFDDRGPRYDRCQESLLCSTYFEMNSDIDISEFSGIILQLTIPSMSGEYDTVKCLTSPNAPWELSPSGSEIRVKESRVAMQGRQQFPMAYEFDGSLCFLEKDRLLGAAAPAPMPLLLEDACIVSDWVDYWYTATASSA